MEGALFEGTGNRGAHHDGRRRRSIGAAPALPNVRAARFLAYGGQLETPHGLFQPRVVLSLRNGRLQPLWLGGVLPPIPLLGRLKSGAGLAGNKAQSPSRRRRQLLLLFQCELRAQAVEA